MILAACLYGLTLVNPLIFLNDLMYCFTELFISKINWSKC